MFGFWKLSPWHAIQPFHLMYVRNVAGRQSCQKNEHPAEYNTQRTKCHRKRRQQSQHIYYASNKNRHTNEKWRKSVVFNPTPCHQPVIRSVTNNAHCIRLLGGPAKCEVTKLKEHSAPRILCYCRHKTTKWIRSVEVFFVHCNGTWNSFCHFGKL